MEELHEIIIKEKLKESPDKEYIQFLQQLIDRKEMAKHLVSEVKEKMILEKVHKQNMIELDDYFKYSGETEKNTNIVDRLVWKNRMVDRLKEYMEDKECNSYGWYKKPVTFILDNGTRVIAMMDDEGNDGGVLTCLTHEKEEVFPK